jgi:catalase
MSTSEQLPVLRAIEVIEKSTGTCPGYRRAHARGLVLHGAFQPTAEARGLTTAEHFQGSSIPTQIRLSNASGNPFANDRMSASKGKALGLAVRFKLPSGGTASWAAVNLPAFPARTPEDFIQVTATQRSFLGMQPNPFKVIAYLLTHPSTFPAIKAIARLKPARSFATAAFNGLHTYFLVNAQGVRQPVRYSWFPRAGVEELSLSDSKHLPQQYLLDEIRQRLAASPVQWELRFHLAQHGDALLDASQAWPADRKMIVAGTLTAIKPEPDQSAVEGLVFDPTGVVPGIELSDDPLLRFRSQVYSESFKRRSQETREKLPPVDLGQ